MLRKERQTQLIAGGKRPELVQFPYLEENRNRPTIVAVSLPIGRCFGIHRERQRARGLVRVPNRSVPVIMKYRDRRVAF